MSKIISMKNLFRGSLRSKQTVVGVISLILFVSVVSFVVFQVTKDSVVVNANGKEEEILTHANTVGDLLDSEGIAITQYDKVSPSLNTKIVDGMTVDWEQAREVTISVDGSQSKVWTTESKVKNILEEANIEVTEQDKLSAALDAEVGETNQIDIQKAFQLTLVDGLEERQVWSTSTTVANFLKQQGIQLNEFDRVENGLEKEIAPGDKITVVRVEKVTDVVEEAIDFAVETKSDSSLLKGKEKVITQGEPGKVARTYEITKKNGKVSQKVIKSEEVIQEPTTKVVAVGTKVVTAAVSRSKSTASSSSSKEFYVTATAYTANCSGCSGITATGLALKDGMKVIAVDPSVIPLGSKVWVEGYGNAIAADKGSAIKGNKIDVFIGSNSKANSWGRKKVRIKVLN
ncbi:G5 and 3D domain-containing protein [Ureibacillus aquaedulcis]|uniref:Ubiquitin-like domain-containing protein n=1 Tax=Ureibacillus aquaedulcis TaxID=3058421 RepID=A0ABT8GVF4_9BACL|nr:G5 and 3D domain-containing protein [Ureibacillus sp. BA0131]MDN4495393.1 ubiquitin-like domain-containing protein [Ureibacillus sp. BA0131]